MYPSARRVAFPRADDGKRASALDVSLNIRTLVLPFSSDFRAAFPRADDGKRSAALDVSVNKEL